MATEIIRVRAGITNIFLLRERGTVVVDPGGPAGGLTGFRKVLPLLGTPPRLDLIVLTHGHFDHVAAAARLREATGAPIAVHRADAPFLAAGRPIMPAGVTPYGKFFRATFGPFIRRMEAGVITPDLLLDDAGIDLEPYGVSGLVIHTPGHSPGSVSIVLPSGDAFVGDLAMNGGIFSRRPTFGIFAHHPEQVPASWGRLLELGVRTVHPAHGRHFPAARLA